MLLHTEREACLMRYHKYQPITDHRAKALAVRLRLIAAQRNANFESTSYDQRVVI